MGKIIQLYFHTIVEKSIFVNTDTDIGGLPLADRIAFHIRRGYMTGITSRSIAKKFFVNQSYMARAFKEAYGCTVTEYINRIRCENAERLLQSTTVPVHNIALNVGYADANYFMRMYKRFYGCNPKEYRERVQRSGRELLNASEK
jgi:two-component system response regulator YesN